MFELIVFSVPLGHIDVYMIRQKDKAICLTKD